ncbi:MAG: type I 3-dehydroquinate dehydratase [Akkermansiaceae bacterium]
MRNSRFTISTSRPNVVGSFGDIESLREAKVETLANQCDIAEIRLDLIHDDVNKHGPLVWEHLKSFPLLFTARCQAEGSPINLDPFERTALLELALADASLIDIELDSVPEMHALIGKLASKNLSWVASFHDFEKMPSCDDLERKLEASKKLGAEIFKVASMMDSIDDVAKLASFQEKYSDGSLASMGMGILGPVSRLLCAQAGSALNYGYLGTKSTAPGQWSAEALFTNIHSLEPLS